MAVRSLVGRNALYFHDPETTKFQNYIRLGSYWADRLL